MNDPYMTNVKLLNVPLESDSLHTLYFTSESNQQSYFSSKVVDGCNFTEFSYQRKDSIIRVPLQYDSLISKGVNYVMYQNKAFSNKWFYAFIKDIIFVSNGRSDLVIETDVIQTWFFDYTIKPSFVEREHVDNDTIGAHTLPENLETGDYIVKSQVDSKIGTAHLVIACTWDPLKHQECSGFVNGVYHGVGYFLIKEWVNTELTIRSFLGALATDGKNDAITGMFMVPDTLTNYNNIEWDSFENPSTDLIYTQFKRIKLDYNTSTNLGDMVIQKETSDINGYTPRNKKLFTFPYQYLLCSNNAGGNGIYKYEYFSASPFSFGIEGAISPGCSIRTFPKYYKGIAMNNEEGLNGAKYPVCSYNTDVYTNWLTQNAVNVGVSVASSALQVIGGVGAMATGAGAGVGAGMVLNGALGIASSLGQVYQHSLIPPQAEGNLNCGDVTYGMGKTEFTFYKMQIKKEYAQIIDKYFDMYGYKVNIVKTPNKAHRSRYWYTKTIDVNIDGAIPNMDMQKIKDCYNRGITFWRNDKEIQDYSLSNTIV
jgi:hypothetical protein